MIICDSGLAKALKRAYRGGGYTVARDGDHIWLLASNWFVQCRKNDFPRRALGTIVEHIGLVPDKGEAYFAHKETEPQTSIFAEIEHEKELWVGGENIEVVGMTHMTFKGARIFQALGNIGEKPVFAVSQINLTILEPDVTVMSNLAIADSARLLIHGDHETVVIAAAGKHSVAMEPKDMAIFEALEHVDL